MPITIPIHRVPDRSCKAIGRSKAAIVGYAVVDDDQAHLGEHFWTLFTGYAATRQKRKTVFMHHMVAGRKRGFDVSHENADKLDNRRSNLRHVTRSQNMLNPADGPKRSLKSNSFRGVTRDDKNRTLAEPWRGKVTVGGKTFQTRRCATAQEAAAALESLKRDLRVRQMPVLKELAAPRG